MVRWLDWWRFGAGDVGARCERAAARHLKREGYRVLARNLRHRFGEIDILAEAADGRTIVVVEVKGRAVDGGSEASAHRPELHVNRRKQKKLMQLAAMAARRLKLSQRPFRFDVIGVDLPSAGEPTVRHHVAAFECDR